MSDPAHQEPDANAGAPATFGLLAEYTTVDELLEASRAIKKAGYTHWDTYTPFPVHGIERAMGIRQTRLPVLVLCAAACGLALAIWLQWWTNAVDYPWIVSGKPFWSIPANVPIMFELTVLFAAITAMVGMLVRNGLPRPSHPLDFQKRFARATDDRFFLVVEAQDPKFDLEATRALLSRTHAHAVEEVPEDHTTPTKLPVGLVYALIVLSVAAIVPFALIAKAREAKSHEPRIHLNPDMDWQPKFKAQKENLLFADRRAMREPVVGTIARGGLREDRHLYEGKVAGTWARTFPPSISFSEETMERGEMKFGVYCAPCHGPLGDGQGLVHQRASRLGQGWVPPTDLHEARIHEQPVGELFHSITSGIRNMPAYGPQISAEDRWAIVLYLRALQKSRSASVAELSPELRAQVK